MTLLPFLLAAALGPGQPLRQPEHEAQHPPAGAFPTPASVRSEHQEIHAVLDRATTEAGEVGRTARRLKDLLEPHFRREEEIATPPLSLLVPLSRGPATEDMRRVLPMTQALEHELPKMLEEHRRIGAAREQFERAARRAGREDYVRLAETLGDHARQEEEILYPAAVLVGRYVERSTGP
jgi:hypothetical protein